MLKAARPEATASARASGPSQEAIQGLQLSPFLVSVSKLLESAESFGFKGSKRTLSRPVATVTCPTQSSPPLVSTRTSHSGTLWTSVSHWIQGGLGDSTVALQSILLLKSQSAEGPDKYREPRRFEM